MYHSKNGVIEKFFLEYSTFLELVKNMIVSIWINKIYYTNMFSKGITVHQNALCVFHYDTYKRPKFAIL